MIHELLAEEDQNQFEFLTKVKAKVDEAHQAIIDIRQVRKDVDFLKEKFGKEDAYQDLIKEAEELEQEMTIIEQTIHETQNQSVQDPLNYGIKVNNRLAFLLADQQRGDFPPTDQAEGVYDQLSNELDGYLDKLDNLLEEKLDRINQLAGEKGVPVISEPNRKGPEG